MSNSPAPDGTKTLDRSAMRARIQAQVKAAQGIETPANKGESAAKPKRGRPKGSTNKAKEKGGFAGEKSDSEAYEAMIRGLKEVCADPSNPRFYDATKLLADLKGWKGREPSTAERIDSIDPASVVQLIVTAVDAHRPVQDILDRFLSRSVTSTARSKAEDA